MPTPKATVISLSAAQRNSLTQLTHQTTNSYRLVRRASIILAAADGASNSRISDRWQLDRNQVRQWRQRWVDAQETLTLCEVADETGSQLRQQILSVLADIQRPGVPVTFTPEQVVQIVAIACEVPQASGRAVNRWTPSEVADEAIKREIVPRISASSVRRFLG
ncbi:MAG: helix-turn-helix domain-containing protein [Thermosynechococcaceae cyanobacterium]